jgi:hypothetical protein
MLSRGRAGNRLDAEPTGSRAYAKLVAPKGARLRRQRKRSAPVMGSAARVTSAAEGLPRRRFTVAEVEAMVAAGVMEVDERVELIGGNWFRCRRRKIITRS